MTRIKSEYTDRRVRSIALLCAIRDILGFIRFRNLPLGLVLEYGNVLIYRRAVSGYRLS